MHIHSEWIPGGFLDLTGSDISGVTLDVEMFVIKTPVQSQSQTTNFFLCKTEQLIYV